MILAKLWVENPALSASRGQSHCPIRSSLPRTCCMDPWKIAKCHWGSIWPSLCRHTPWCELSKDHRGPKFKYLFSCRHFSFLVNFVPILWVLLLVDSLKSKCRQPMAICRRLPTFPDWPCNGLGRRKFGDKIGNKLTSLYGISVCHGWSHVFVMSRSGQTFYLADQAKKCTYENIYFEKWNGRLHT